MGLIKGCECSMIWMGGYTRNQPHKPQWFIIHFNFVVDFHKFCCSAALFMYKIRSRCVKLVILLTQCKQKQCSFLPGLVGRDTKSITGLLLPCWWFNEWVAIVRFVGSVFANYYTVLEEWCYLLQLLWPNSSKVLLPLYMGMDLGCLVCVKQSYLSF
jgi:hypothetical protein